MPVHKIVDYRTKTKKFRVIDFNFLEMAEFLRADKNVSLNTTFMEGLTLRMCAVCALLFCSGTCA
jgi:hypothetical protein